MKRTGERTKPDNTTVLYRDFWGPAVVKRQGLLASLPTGSPPEGSTVPVYERVTPSPENRWRLGPKIVEGGFEAWPSLEELFPVNFQGINHNRGLEGGIIDTDRKALEQRLSGYFAADDFLGVQNASAEIATVRARYNPENVWLKLKADGHFKKDTIFPLLTFPFDRRFIYYVVSDKWLNEARPEFARNAANNEWLITVPEPRKASETLPVFATEFVNLHVHERGSVVFPRQTHGSDLLSDSDANLPEATWRILRDHFGLTGERRDDSARALVGRLFRVIFAVLHAPSYQAEHKSALSADWAHVPIPRDAKLLDRLAAAGEQITRLLDSGRDAGDVIKAVIGADRARALGQLKRTDARQVRADDLKVTVTYWGGGKGRWKPRAFTAEELPATEFGKAWGERTGDLFVNDHTYFSDVPELVWNYQLGGYPVLKKWLGYRQADRRDGKPLTDDERRWFREVIQRIAALLALGPALDALYQEAAANAFTIDELGITR